MPEEVLAAGVRFFAVAAFRLGAVLAATFFAGDFAPLVVFRVFAAVDFDPLVERPPPVAFFEDAAVDFLDDAAVDFLDDAAVDFPDVEARLVVFLEDDLPFEAFFEVDRALDVDVRPVELLPDFAAPDLPAAVLAPVEVVFFADEARAPDVVPFFAEVDLALEDVPRFAVDPVEPDAFLAVVFVAGDFFAADAVLDFDPAFEVDFDEVDFLAEVFDEVCLVVAIGPPVIKVLSRVYQN